MSGLDLTTHAAAARTMPREVDRLRPCIERLFRAAPHVQEPCVLVLEEPGDIVSIVVKERAEFLRGVSPRLGRCVATPAGPACFWIVFLKETHLCSVRVHVTPYDARGAS